MYKYSMGVSRIGKRGIQLPGIHALIFMTDEPRAIALIAKPHTERRSKGTINKPMDPYDAYHFGNLT